MSEDRVDLAYCLAKQLPRASHIVSDYGDFHLDDEMSAAVEKALRPILESRLRKLNAAAREEAK